MRAKPFLTFHRAAESAGYPALLVVSVVCLTLVVAPVALLGLTRAGWVLGLAMLSVIAAVAVLAGAITAALSEESEPAAEGTDVDARRPAERERVVPLPRRKAASQDHQDHEAA